MTGDAAGKAHGPLLLVVDDEPLNRDLLKRVLMSQYRVIEAGDAETALKLLEEQGPAALVICDHLMPGRSGTDLAADIRRRWPATPCLLLTGYDDAPEVLAAQQSGTILEVISKPFTHSALKSAISRALTNQTGDAL